MGLLSFFDYNLPSAPAVWGFFSWQHLMMLAVCLLLTLSLYVLPKQYAFLSQTNYFIYTLVVFQILLMVGLRTIQIIAIPKYIENGATWAGVFPLDYCALTQIFSIIAVFWSSNKWFSITLLYPIFGSWLSIILPSSPELLASDINLFRFWEFFLAHFLSFFIYFYMYLFGKRTYMPQFWKISVLSLLILSGFIYIINTSFYTHFMFMGRDLAPGPIDFRNYLSAKLLNLACFINTMFVIFVVGFGGFFLIYFLLKILKPLYLNNGAEKLHESWFYIVVEKIKNHQYKTKH